MDKNTKKQTVLGLKRMLKLIKNGWTKYANARNKWGTGVDVKSKDACRFCIMGASHRAFGNQWFALDGALSVLQSQTPSFSLVSFNDAKKTKKSDVIALIERAIKILEYKNMEPITKTLAQKIAEVNAQLVELKRQERAVRRAKHQELVNKATKGMDYDEIHELEIVLSEKRSSMYSSDEE